MTPDKISNNLARKLLSLEMDKKNTKEFFYKIPRGCFNDLLEIYKIYESKFDELIKENLKGKKAKEDLDQFYLDIFFKQIEAQSYNPPYDFF